jgi:hypothetical protein
MVRSCLAWDPHSLINPFLGPYPTCSVLKETLSIIVGSVEHKFNNDIKDICVKIFHYEII